MDLSGIDQAVGGSGGCRVDQAFVANVSSKRSLLNRLGSFWDHSGITLGSFWGHFGVTLGSLWGHFGQLKKGHRLVVNQKKTSRLIDKVTKIWARAGGN